MPSYHSDVRTYTISAATLSTDADLLKIAGPYGKSGRVIGVECCVTTAVTVAANLISIGSGSDEDAYATLSVAVGAAETVANNFTDLTSDSNLITADTAVLVHTGGECTAGAGTITLTISWF